MPKLTIDGIEVEVPAGSTVLQACEQIGAEIPRFCYHEKLSIAGNCRMCLVQIEGGPPKPAASCAMPAAEGMKVHTNTPMVKKAREGVMEFLLINHPLDCPICDQGGECDLQDQAMAFGGGISRFNEYKRAVKDKNLGPLIKTHMTRCIHCTRCIRFATEIAGVQEMGATGRGEHMEVGTYVEKAVTSELSGNMIDLCPVGALTSKPYAFKARSWELRKIESIDVLDAVGSNIRVDYRGREVMRILPKANDLINEEWISDKTRFSYDGLMLQRLDKPYIKKDGKLVAVTWDEALKVIKDKISATQPSKIGAIIGDMVDCESMVAIKDLMNKIGSKHIDSRQDGIKISHANRANYLFNTTIAGIEQSDLCILIGANPRFEASLVGARLRKRKLMGGFTVASIGEIDDQTYKIENLGNNTKVIEELLSGNHPFCEKIKNATNPMIIVGNKILQQDKGEELYNNCLLLAEKYNFIQDNWNGFNILHLAASRVGALDLGLTPKLGGMSVYQQLDAASKGELQVIYLLGADEIDVSKLQNTFVIYQGHHGDKGAHCADVILPAAAYTEKNATYVNLEGRVQHTRAAVPLIGDSKEDYLIIVEIAKSLGFNLGYENLNQVRARMIEIAPYMRNIGEIATSIWEKTNKTSIAQISVDIDARMDNFYMTNPISRASKIMAQCLQELQKKNEAA
jgi:NADH-quinone oxidoreductase subunit G